MKRYLLPCLALVISVSALGFVLYTGHRITARREAMLATAYYNPPCVRCGRGVMDVNSMSAAQVRNEKTGEMDNWCDDCIGFWADSLGCVSAEDPTPVIPGHGIGGRR